MSGLAEIGIRIDETLPAENARALLHELETHLQRLLETGESAQIDLASLPLTPADHELLDQVLGEGEVFATVSGLGVSEISDTAIPCVWRIEYYNSEEALVAEFIEVSRCPELLLTPVEDMQESPSLLRAAAARSDQGE